MRIDTRTLTKMALLVALLCISAYIIFPLPFTPVMISLTTLIFNLAAFMLAPRHTFIVCVVYTLLGAVGLPVFSGGQGGLSRLVGPTGGFIFAFIIAYTLVSYLKGNTRSFWRYATVGVLVGIPITYIGGVAGLMAVTGVGLWPALTMAALPFIPGDIIKCLIAAYVATKMKI